MNLEECIKDADDFSPLRNGNFYYEAIMTNSYYLFIMTYKKTQKTLICLFLKSWVKCQRLKKCCLFKDKIGTVHVEISF